MVRLTMRFNPTRCNQMRHCTTQLLALCFVIASCVGCKQETPAPNVSTVPIELKSTSVKFDIPLGLPELMVPNSNPLTAEKIELGRKLFFDKNLSLDRTMSCATCHDPEKGWSNDSQFAIGVTGDAGARNVPTVVNSAYSTRQFWDGRDTTLEAQALGPLTNPIEMAMPSTDAILDRVRENAEYMHDFQQAFDNGLTIKNLAKAIASFERTILLGDTPYDRYVAGDKTAMSASAIRGFTVFREKGRCTECHKEPLFTDRQFYNLGIGMDAENPDVGRFAVTKLPSNIGRFKTPGLRNVTKTAPYMHDGSMKTLEEVIDIYDKGGIPNEHLSSENIRKLNLSESEKDDLLAFMVEGLTSEPAKSITYTAVSE